MVEDTPPFWKKTGKFIVWLFIIIFIIALLNQYTNLLNI